MKLELNVGSHVVVIEAEGAVSVSVREVKEAPPQEEAAPPVYALPSAPSVPSPSPASDAGLFSRLVGLRKELASEQGLPPYVIFHDKTLRDMAEVLPQDMEALSNIGGVGRAKLEKYGARFLAVIQGVAV